MPHRSIRGGSRRKCTHLRQSAWPVFPQPKDRIQQCGIPTPKGATSAPLANYLRSRACGASASIEQVILQAVWARGGRLVMADLVFEVRWHGMHPDLIGGVVDELVGYGLLRGPLSESMAYELTATGWDLCAGAMGRA